MPDFNKPQIPFVISVLAHQSSQKTSIPKLDCLKTDQDASIHQLSLMMTTSFQTHHRLARTLKELRVIVAELEKKLATVPADHSNRMELLLKLNAATQNHVAADQTLSSIEETLLRPEKATFSDFKKFNSAMLQEIHRISLLT